MPPQTPVVRAWYVQDGRFFPTVEHYFQAAKYVCIGAHDLAAQFETGGAVGNDPSEAKRRGGRKGMNQAGCVLDVAAWEQLADGVMWAAICGRLHGSDARDPFRDVLQAVVTQNVALLHFERSGVRSYWGGNIAKATANPP